MLAALMVIALPAVWNMYRWPADRALAKRLHQRQQEPLPDVLGITDLPRVSFLAAAWNEQPLVLRFINHVLALPYPNLELVLCAGGQDGTFQTAQDVHDPRLVLLEQQSGEGKQHSLQRCLQASHGEIIYLIDADCMIDPATFQRCLSPLLSGEEQVVSGSFYVPLPEQQHEPFVISQLSGLAYSAAKQPNYVAGLLGGNCVLTRLALQGAGEFTNPVTIGTDFDLSRRLLASGQRIRMQLLGWIVSEFPAGWSAYRRQQSRWLRNLFLIGRKYGSRELSLFSLRTASIGLAMLVLPFLVTVLVIIGGGWSLAGGILLLAWLLLFCQAFFARLRYLGFTRLWLGIPYPAPALPLLLLYLLLDFLVWSLVLVELAWPGRRWQW